MDSVILAIKEISPIWRSVAAISLNNTQRDAMNQARIKQMRSFTTRATAFDMPPDPVPGPWRANPDRLQVTIALFDPNSPVGKRETQIFDKFGTAQVKNAPDPRQPIAIPTKALRPQGNVLVPRSMYPNKIVDLATGGAQGKFTFKRTKSGIDVRKVAVGAFFVIPESGGKAWGVWQRIGPNARDVRMLWMFRHDVKIPHRLDFEADTQAVIDARWQINFDEAWNRAVGVK